MEEVLTEDLILSANFCNGWDTDSWRAACNHAGENVEAHGKTTGKHLSNGFQNLGDPASTDLPEMEGPNHSAEPWAREVSN